MAAEEQHDQEAPHDEQQDPATILTRRFDKDLGTMRRVRAALLAGLEDTA